MLQNIASTKCRKIGGLRNYQRGGNLKKGEVNFERGGSDPLGNYVWCRITPPTGYATTLSYPKRLTSFSLHCSIPSMLSKNLQANSVYCCQSNVSHAHLRMFSKIEFHSKHSNEASCSQRRFATPLSLVDKILLDVNIWDLPGIYFSDQHVIDTLNNKKQRHIYNFISIARHTHFSLITDQLRYEKGCGTARHLIRKVGYEKYHAHRNHCFKQSDWVNYLRGRILVT